MHLYSQKISLSLNYGKPAKPVNNVKTPPFSSGIWKRYRPRASKTALGLRPWAVLEALGRHLFQNPSKKGGVLAHYTLNCMTACTSGVISCLCQQLTKTTPN